MEKVQGNRPTIWWRVECYHYEPRYRTVTETRRLGAWTWQETETESYQERVVTWIANEI